MSKFQRVIMLVFTRTARFYVARFECSSTSENGEGGIIRALTLKNV